MGDLLGGGVHGSLDLVLPLLAHRARLSIDTARKDDHRVGGGRHGGCASFPQLLADRGIRKPGAVHQLIGEGVG